MEPRISSLTHETSPPRPEISTLKSEISPIRSESSLLRPEINSLMAKILVTIRSKHCANQANFRQSREDCFKAVNADGFIVCQFCSVHAQFDYDLSVFVGNRGTHLVTVFQPSPDFVAN